MSNRGAREKLCVKKTAFKRFNCIDNQLCYIKNLTINNYFAQSEEWIKMFIFFKLFNPLCTLWFGNAMKRFLLFSFVLLTLTAKINCIQSAEDTTSPGDKVSEGAGSMEMSTGTLEKATFAGGCFWCMESPFEKLEGVTEVISGYTDGHKENPTYKEVSSGTTGHLESIQIIYDPSKITYTELLDVFWRQVDPTDPGGQFVDRGQQYTTAIFYHNDEQKALAEASKEKLNQSGRYDNSLVTPIKKASKFYPAEEYHQDYYDKNPIRYKYYRYNSGRDRYLKKIWGEDKMKTSKTDDTKKKYSKPSDEELKDKVDTTSV